MSDRFFGYVSDVRKNNDLQDENADSVQVVAARQCLETGTITFLLTPNRTRIARATGIPLDPTSPTPEGRKTSRARCCEVPPE